MEVIGLMRGVTKTGKDFTILHLKQAFDSWAQENRGAVGFKAIEEYVPGYVGVNVGDIVELKYDKGFNGMAICSGVKVL